MIEEEEGEAEPITVMPPVELISKVEPFLIRRLPLTMTGTSTWTVVFGSKVTLPNLALLF